jgi:hypothetical protein
MRTALTSLSLCIASLALGGCEILAFAVGSMDEDGPEDPDKYAESCPFEPADGGPSLPSDFGEARLVAYDTTTWVAANPTSRIAMGEALHIVTEVETDSTVAWLFGSGAIELSAASSPCAMWSGNIGVEAEVTSSEAGTGRIVLHDVNGEIDRFSFEVVDPASIEIVLDEVLFWPVAIVKDADGNPVFADRSITWDVQPASLGVTAGQGRMAPYFYPDPTIMDTVVLQARRGDLTSEVTFVVQADGTLSEE